MASPLLDIRNLTFEVDRHAILERLDLAVQPGEIHALLGANGSGKTTLAHLLMGCEGYVPSAGHVLFDGTDLLPLRMHERARLGLTLAWQEPARFEDVTVREYLTLGHYHGPHGRVQVLPHATIKIGKGARYFSDFSLLSGSVGNLDIDYLVEVEEEGIAELSAKIFAHKTDHIILKKPSCSGGSAHAASSRPVWCWRAGRKPKSPASRKPMPKARAVMSIAWRSCRARQGPARFPS